MDDGGHGTHTAGTICAEGDNGIGVTGVAWDCKIMALKFLGGPQGTGSTADAISALDYAVMMGAKVSNNSWGGGGFSIGLYQAIQNAGAAGHLFVAAAGNSGVDTDASAHYPSSYSLDNIISVAATDNGDQLAVFSSGGSNYGATSVDVGAPGKDIASTWIAPSNYVWASGTSMATPHVTGLAALIWDVNPGWTALQVKNRILGTVRPLTALSGKTVTGGIINAFDALGTPEPGTPPDAPTNLAATAMSDTEIELLWIDNATNEDDFLIERKLTSEGAGAWSQVATVGMNVESYTESSLTAETGYDYRVRASNTVGESGYSNTTSATTEATPSMQLSVAISETPGAGSVSGSFQDTWAEDGVVQSITKRESGGRKSSRYSYLEHTWDFYVAPGVTMLEIAYEADEPTADGDHFEFSYSIGGAPFVTLGDPAADFPTTAVGSVRIRVRDTDQMSGNKVLDTIGVDHIAITSYVDNGGDPPVTPSGLSASAAGPYQVDLNWTDNSGDEGVGEEELGFRIERSSGGGSWASVGTVGADVEAYSDTSVSPATSYDYQVVAFNASGDSPSPSNTASVTTPAGADITLSLGASYKDKGWHYVVIDWTDEGAAGSYDVFRNGGAPLASGVSGPSYEDNAIGKGGATYVYQVCPSGSAPPAPQCSNEVQVIF